MSNYNKLLEIYNNLSALLVNSNNILEKAMKYVPISTKAGTELHNEYESNKKQTIKILSKKEGV